MNSRNFQNNRLKDLYAYIKKLLFASVAILNKKVVVDFCDRMLAFRGGGGELPGSHLSRHSPQESNILLLQSTV